MDNKCKKIICTSMENANLRRFIKVNKIITKNNIRGSRPRGTKLKTRTVSQLVSQLQSSRVQWPFQSLLCFSHYLLMFSPTKPTTFSRLCKNLSSFQTSEFTQISLKSANISLCHINIHSTDTLLS